MPPNSDYYVLDDLVFRTEDDSITEKSLNCLILHAIVNDYCSEADVDVAIENEFQDIEFNKLLYRCWNEKHRQFVPTMGEIPEESRPPTSRPKGEGNVIAFPTKK